MPYDCPLGDENCQKLNAILEKARSNLEMAKDCIDCGWPAEDLQAANQQTYDMAMKTKAKFFPGHP